MSQYAELDRLILARIVGSGNSGVELTGIIYKLDVRVEAERIADATGRHQYRVVDGRLQALRKAGKITFSSKVGWVAPEPKP
jgi:hypothetical protein